MQIRQKFITVVNHVAGQAVERHVFIEQAGGKLTVAAQGHEPFTVELTEAEATNAFNVLVEQAI